MLTLHFLRCLCGWCILNVPVVAAHSFLYSITFRLKRTLSGRHEYMIKWLSLASAVVVHCNVFHLSLNVGSVWDSVCERVSSADVLFFYHPVILNPYPINTTEDYTFLHCLLAILYSPVPLTRYFLMTLLHRRDEYETFLTCIMEFNSTKLFERYSMSHDITSKHISFSEFFLLK